MDRHNRHAGPSRSGESPSDRSPARAPNMPSGDDAHPSSTMADPAQPRYDPARGDYHEPLRQQGYARGGPVPIGFDTSMALRDRHPYGIPLYDDRGRPPPLLPPPPGVGLPFGVTHMRGPAYGYHTPPMPPPERPLLDPRQRSSGGGTTSLSGGASESSASGSGSGFARVSFEREAREGRQGWEPADAREWEGRGAAGGGQVPFGGRMGRGAGSMPPDRYGSSSGQQIVSNLRQESDRPILGDSDILPVDKDIREAARMVARGKDRETALEDGWDYGPPLAISDGIFAGKVLRFAVQCVQQPVHGRRKTDKDRRSLAPVPIVQLRIRECRAAAAHQDEGWVEADFDISSLEPSHIVCAAELSEPSTRPPDSILDPRPTEGPPDVRGLNKPFAGDHPSGGSPPRPVLHPHASYSGEINPGVPEPLKPMHHVERGASPSAGRPHLRHRASWIADGHWDSSSGTVASGGQDASTSTPTQMSYRVPSHPERLRRRLRDEGEESETSGDELDSDGRANKRLARPKVRRNLFGTLHVSAVRVPDMDGTLGLWFLFTDLCIRHEGTYSLHFRAFDLSVVTPLAPSVPDLGACTSQTFKVYSPRQFPGLPKPTELSEHFVRQGFKLNTRKNERLIKTPSPSSPNAS